MLGIIISSPETAPKFIIRLACMLYDALLLLAVLFFAAFIYLALTQAFNTPKIIFQLYLVFITASYFLWFWTHGGQTLAMKTWRIQLKTKTGQALGTGQALLRFILAGLSLGLLGLGVVWALFDKDKQFLHDRLAGTRLLKLAYKGD